MSELTFDHAVLDNGLTVIGERNPQSQSFAAGYFVKTGSRDESAQVAGVSHFLEHMMFKGTDRRSAEDINREFDELGARYNAFTSDERTVYYGAVLAEERAKLLDLLSDMMRPALRESDFEVEKNVILEEIAMYDDRPDFKVFEEGNPRYFNGHPLGNAVLGSTSSVSALSRAQMLEYFNERYAPNNLILTVAGNYDWDELLHQVAALTAAWQLQETARAYPPLHAKHGAETMTSEKLKRVHVAAFAPGVSAQDSRRYAAALLANCLGDTDGSRLYWALVDPGLVEAASLSHDNADGLGTFVAYLATGTEQLDEVMRVFKDVLDEAQEQGLTEEEWGRAQRKLETSLTLRAETPLGRLMPLGARYQYTGEYQAVADELARIFGTSLEDGQALLAERPFDKLFTLTLAPPV